jgi:hypothetical protein
MNNFNEENNQAWIDFQQKLFPDGLPSHAEWTAKEDIIRILNSIGNVNSLCHMMYPDTGGNDLERVAAAGEKGCIEFNIQGNIDIVKPKRLVYNSFTENPMFNYFYLETEELKPLGFYEIDEESCYEEILEVAPGEYKKGHLDEEGNPNGAREVMRYFKGSFVIVAKTSPYNKSPKTYSGFHNKMSLTDFRNFMLKCSQIK